MTLSRKIAYWSGLPRLLVLAYLLPWALLGYCVAYLLRRPDDWTGPVIVGTASIVLAFFLHRGAARAMSRVHADYAKIARIMWITAQIACPIGGIVIAVMIYRLLGTP